MPRLKDRNKQTPGGHKFYDPILKYRSQPWASVDQIAAGLIQARLGNPALTQKHGWSTDATTVQNEVDETIARHCIQMGWRSFIVDDAPGGDANSTPFHRPQSQRFLGKLKNAVAASEMFIDFGLSREQAVPIQKATERAEICITCPFNEKPKSWLDHFTTTASEGIRRSFEKVKGWKLPIPHEDELGLCTACYCPLGLKVYFPIDRIEAQLAPEIRAQLPDYCWIRRELGE